MNLPPIIPPPDLRALLNAHRDEIFSSLNCHQLGTIQSFDKDAQTVSVQIATKRVVYNTPQTTDSILQQTPTLVDYPLLVDVPVFILSGGGGSIRFPIANGDTCLVLFNDRDIDNWQTAGDTGAPNSSRMHSLADGMALVGFFNLANRITDYVDGKMQIKFGTSVITLEANQVTIVNSGSTIQLQTGGNIVITAGGKVAMSNGTVSLITALDALMTALTTWVNTGGSTPNPATVTALNAVKTQLDNLLA
jgi:hypothetical protein